VTFGRQVSKKPKELEHQNFYLLHLSMVREYLELEFQELEQEGVLDFPFDMERVIDDFILMAFFVGNDFLPNLPNLHINEGALALMFKLYKEVLPKMGGYINEQGVINVQRLGMLVEALSGVEHRFFEAENSDAQWIKSKKNDGSIDLQQKPKELTLTPAQKEILKTVKNYVQNRSDKASEPLDLPPTLPARDRTFVERLADELRLSWSSIDNENGDRFMRLQLPQSQSDGDEEDDDEDEEASMAVQRIIRKYEKAKVQEMTPEEAQEAAEKKYDAKFQEWKDNYYRSKFGWGLDNQEEMKKLAQNYVQGLQWVLFYYYRGIASWPWFFQYHYAPMISGELHCIFDLIPLLRLE
jgi:5'-3' exoribonuclease 1